MQVVTELMRARGFELGMQVDAPGGGLIAVFKGARVTTNHMAVSRHAVRTASIGRPRCAAL